MKALKAKGRALYAAALLQEWERLVHASEREMETLSRAGHPDQAGTARACGHVGQLRETLAEQRAMVAEMQRTRTFEAYLQMEQGREWLALLARTVQDHRTALAAGRKRLRAQRAAGVLPR